MPDDLTLQRENTASGWVNGLLDVCSHLYEKICQSIGPHFTLIYVGKFGLLLQHVGASV